MKKQLRLFITLFLGVWGICFAQLQPDSNNIIYVNISVSGGNGNGSSWANAVPELADALKWARTQITTDATYFDAAPLKIYVAKGTYKPLYHSANGSYSNNNRHNSFVMVKNVQLYGGFDPANGITDLTHDRIKPTTTQGSILSGNIGNANTNNDNAHHVVIAVGALGNAVLDGFSLIHGTTGGSGSYSVN